MFWHIALQRNLIESSSFIGTTLVSCWFGICRKTNTETLRLALHRSLNVQPNRTSRAAIAVTADASHVHLHGAVATDRHFTHGHTTMTRNRSWMMRSCTVYSVSSCMVSFIVRDCTLGLSSFLFVQRSYVLATAA